MFIPPGTPPRQASDLTPSVINLAQQARQFKQQGQSDQAILTYEQALALDDTLPELWFNYANLLQALLRYPEAAAAQGRALALNPNFFQAHLNLANILRNQGHKDKAIEHYRQALRLQPHLTLAHRNLGKVLMDLERPQEALEVFSAWAKIEPHQPGPLNGIGMARQALGQFDFALMAFQQALALDPNSDDSLNNLGTLLHRMNRSQEALVYLRQALVLNPQDEITLANLIHTLLATGEISESLRLSERLLAQSPQSATGYLMRGYALIYQARITEALASFEQCWQLDHSATNAITNALFALFYQDHYSPQQFTEALHHWVKRLPDPSCEFPHHQRAKNFHQTLKIGYLSADFRSHPVAFFLEPILTHHDPQQVEVFCYDTADQEDDVTRRLRPLVAHWRSCFALSDQALAQQIYDDQIDILVDLSGYTHGHRARVFGDRPAPIQILYIGYPGTTGRTSIDYVVSDFAVTPPEYESLYTEKILRVNGSFWCFQPHDCAPEPGPLPAVNNGFITFGAFNHSPKLSGTTLQLWAQVLNAVPSSRLLIKNMACADPQTQDYFRNLLIGYGASPERLIFEPPTPDLAQFLQAYQRVDITLDTFPYNGGTTTCESLWMGVPVVTLRGQHFFSRMSHSFLLNLGLAELSARTEPEYISAAQSLADDLDQLQTLRINLREKMRRSPICDGLGAARALEKAYRQAWLNL